MSLGASSARSSETPVSTSDANIEETTIYGLLVFAVKERA